MQIKFMNNWRVKRHWSNLFHYKYNQNPPGWHHILVGIFGLFISINWINIKKPA